MLSGLSLRLRVFLFFCLLAVGGLVLTGVALYLGSARAPVSGVPQAFVFSGLIIGFGLLALIAGIWLLFDENVAKPIERLAASLRAREAAALDLEIDTDAARYLGDLAPAAAGLAGRVSDQTLATAQAVAAETARLKAEKDRLTALLTDIPVAMVLVSPTHQIALYDGQAAGVLAQVAPPRLNASLFDYLNREDLRAAHARLNKTGQDVSAQITSIDGRQSYAARLRPLGAGAGYLLIFDESVAQIAPEEARPLVYDFDLLETPGDKAIEARSLDELCFAVFDTETTGLLPHKDAVVQIGAVRVLRGRLVKGEVFDTLVDPGKPIPPASTRVHRVTDAMVQGAPDIAEAGRQFHHFARDAVIVAHNAPFDMAFLRRDAKLMGVTWDHPILDTVLLSAVLFGASETHTLDALCDRLGVTIPENLRHTALGDAQATAEVLVAMLPMLSARGFKTFGEVIAQTRKHGRLLEDLN
ncbi:exonuclease domain-containing protein [Ruegeria sp. 2205SS24-7]|uniref:3'-5' exonuclease n=1 Tax=Ruegeria discodermiae TaxID=3064389 RepID=UPI0027406627|nr:exonuclease domain-containing protein [Ruegeria sp. 2205SS24-7]MDP5215823.1 exonuclease domain-containing protein [Ruegeria sp. 2205SS24-7]